MRIKSVRSPSLLKGTLQNLLWLGLCVGLYTSCGGSVAPIDGGAVYDSSQYEVDIFDDTSADVSTESDTIGFDMMSDIQPADALDAIPADALDAMDGTGWGPAESWTFGSDTVAVTFKEGEGDLRTYSITSTHPVPQPGPSERTFSEQAGDPILRSGVLLTDALFAMAVEEARQNSVSEISDGAFGEAIECECYKTGEKWNWVWTRDIAYATELGLAWLNPERAAASLLFKLSELKTGGERQIVQDTGTGGSWPVSTDRVTWARGAMAVLRYADHPELKAAAIEAMEHSAKVDRLYAFDVRDGLYRGETSFLDWREQSYPGWTAQNVVHVGMSKSLSTNLNHLFLLRSLEELTGKDHKSADLAVAIDQAFWDGTVYRSYLMTELDPGPTAQQDLLATSLAVLDLGTHPEAMAAYPHGPHGPPVIWPQQQLTPIYHNRGIWPFVTSYSVIASREAKNAATLKAGLDSLVRGAALNLSHMENLELATGTHFLEDGDYSGPVINSRRQLWSVAGFLGAIAHGVFGLKGESGVISGDPILPPGDWFKEGATLRVQGQILKMENQTLPMGAMTTFETEVWTDLFGARSPTLTLNGAGDNVTLTFSAEEGASVDIYKDGVLVASDVSSPWTDTTSVTACYTAVARLTLPSQPSEPVCWWGDNYTRIQSVYASSFDAVGGTFSDDHGREHYGNWGAPEDTLTMLITPTSTGQHLLQLVYGNGAGPIDTGVTAGVKWLKVTDSEDALVAEGSVIMPHRKDWSDWGDSSFLPATLSMGQTYKVTLSDGMNMSYLAHYVDYIGGAGGGENPSNYVNISELKLLYMKP